MEQGATTFLDAAKELGPVVVLLVGVFGILLWQLLRLFTDARDEVRRVSDARVADAMSMQQVMRDTTAALTAQTATAQAQAAAIDRLSSSLDKLAMEVSRVKGG